MPTQQSIPPGQPGPIILVDDEAELVNAVTGMLKTEFGEWRVRGTSHATEALSWVKKEKPSVLITDVRMPEISGLELIHHVHEMWGPTPTVVITAFPTEAVSAGAKRGSFLYLPKPFSFRSLLDTVQQLESAPPASFSGAIAVSTLADLLQLYAISGSTGLMVVKSGGRRGEIWFERGQVTHAATAEAQGFEAMCAILKWPKGSFSWQTRRAETQTIQMNISELMLEAYRIHDEAMRDRAGVSSRPPPPTEVSPSLLDEPRQDATQSHIQACLEKLRRVNGFIGVALVDCENGQMLGTTEGSSLDLSVAAIGNAALLRAKRTALAQLGLQDDIEDILISLGKQYHLMRPLRSRPGVFFYMALERERGSLAMARFSLADAERELVL